MRTKRLKFRESRTSRAGTAWNEVPYPQLMASGLSDRLPAFPCPHCKQKKIFTKAAYGQLLKPIMARHFAETRAALGLTQTRFAEALMIDTRSYIELEHGRSLCCTLVFVSFLLSFCPNPSELLGEIRAAFSSDDNHGLPLNAADP